MSAQRRTALVTCIYNGLHGTPYGGRQNRDADYAASLATIAGCGLPVACFVDPGALDAHAQVFRATAPNVALHPLALADVPGSAAVQRIKRERPADFAGIEWRERCVEIMWGKFHMLRRVLSASPAVTHAYWIDAGLANVNVVSTKYSSMAALQARRYSEVARAFPSVLFDRMSAFAGDRVVALKCTCPHNRGIPDAYNLHPYADGDGLVGGLFGGRREAVLALCDRFDAKVAALLGDGQVYFEESILTGIHADCPDLFRCFTFDSWYHEGWAAYDPGRRPFSTFFDVMLQTPASWPAPRFPWEEPSPDGTPAAAAAVPAPAADDVGDPGDGDDLFDQALHRLGLAFADPYFVQIGAMDGVSFDDFHGYVRMYGWAGLLVEPVPWQFERLKAAYASLPGGATRYAFEPAAVAAHDGTVDMLVIDRAAVDDGRVAPCFGGMSAIWPPRNGLASDGDAEVVRAFGRRLTVPCLTLPTLLARHGVDRLDILCIDAEGWDFAILRQLDVEHLRPAVIRCEWINLGAGERQAALDWLRARGYVARVAGQNLDAVDRPFWQALKSGAGIAPDAGTTAAGDLTLVTAVDPAPGRRGEAVEAMARRVGALAASGRPVVAFVDEALLARCQEATGDPRVRWIGRDAGTLVGVASGGPRGCEASGDAGRARSSSRGTALAAGGVLLLHDAAVMNPFGARWLLWVPPVVMASGASVVGESVTRWQARLARDLRYHVMDLSRASEGTGTGAEARVLGGTVRAIRAVNPRYCALLAAQGPAAEGGPALDALAVACPGLVRAGREAPLASMPS